MPMRTLAQYKSGKARAQQGSVSGTKRTLAMYKGGSRGIGSAVTTLPSGVKITRRLPPEEKLAQLRPSLQRQRAQAEAAGVKVPKEGPTLLSRVFDVLSRGQYTTAGLARGVQRSKGQDIVGRMAAGLRGAGRGFIGREKASFADVIEASGVENRVIRGGVGLALDIALDPTTYVGIGIAKAATKEAIEKAAAKAAQKALKSKKSAQVAEGAKGKLVEDNLLAGLGKPRKRQLDSVAEKARRDYAMNTAADAKAKAIESGKGAVQLKILGKPVYHSKGVYKGFAKVGDIVGNTRTGDWFNKGFRTRAVYGGDINPVKRLHEGVGVGEFVQWKRRDLDTKFVDTTPVERAQISHAIEQGIRLPGKLGELQEFAEAHFKEWGELEVAELGVLKPEDLKPNYVKHVYKKRNENFQKFKNARRALVGPKKPGLAKERKVPTLEDAKAAGLDPVEDIKDLLARRGWEHYQAKARRGFEQELATEYGLIFDKIPKTRMKSVWKAADPKGNVKVKEKIPETYFASDLEGVRLAKEMGYEKVDNPFAVDQDVYLPPQVKAVYDRTMKLFADDEELDRALRHFDKVNSIWKMGATVANPGHHFRNAFGDIWLNYMDGVVNPNRYWDALKTVFHKQDQAVKIGPKTFDGGYIENKMIQLGLKQGYTVSEFGSPVAVGVAQKLRRFSEGREDVARVAHFIDAWKKEAKGIKYHPDTIWRDMDAAAKRAAERVRKFNIDYGDFTEWEQRVMRRVIPFYSFIRKNIPLQFEALAMRPGRVAALPKTQKAIERMLGTDKRDAEIEETIPRWIKEMAEVRLTTGDSPTTLLSRLPVEDIARFSGAETGDIREVGRAFGSDVHPFIRMPGEWLTGHTVFTGGEFPEGVGAFPQLLPAANLAKEMIRADRPWEEKKARAINYALGTGIRPITPRQQVSELRRQEDIIQSVMKKYRQRQSEEIYGPPY